MRITNVKKKYVPRPLSANRVRLAEVYADSDRPIYNGDVAGDFDWRRTHEAPCSPREALDAAWPKLAEFFPGLDRASVKVHYSRHCGCSMCPCSPGFVVTGPSALRTNGVKLMIWLKPA